MEVYTADGTTTTTDFTHFISIDFGTSGCGVSFSTKQNPEIKQVTFWESESSGVKHFSVKCPTVVLLDPFGEFESFGSIAKLSYEKKSGLKYPDRADDYLYFQQFKMHLYDNPDAKEIKAMNEKPFSFIKILALSLQYIKDCTIKELRKNFENPGRKVQWIITVPAIWSPAAKQIMRKAANEAGFDDKSLVFALEPEAAALACLQDLINTKQVEKASYLVVDCGGGTVDIAAHKMSIDEGKKIFIEELVPPHGGNYGGFAVNERFQSMLQDIFFTQPKKDFQTIIKKHPRQWMKMIWTDFEESKCVISSGDKEATIIVHVHKLIRQEVKNITGKDIKTLVEAYKKQEVHWDEGEDGIVLPYSTICDLFNPTLANIVALIRNVLSQPSCGSVKLVLLVGGFAESSLLFSEVKESIGQSHSYIDVKRVPNPVLTVATGAVIFGLKKEIIKSRVMKHSVGVEATVEFSAGEYDKYPKVLGGEKFCEKAFWPLVTANCSVYTGVPSEYYFRPLTEDQQVCIVSIYESPKEDVKYITDDSCHLMGTIEIKIPKRTSDQSREVKLVIDFSRTEYVVLAFSGLGNTEELTVKPTFIHTNKYLPTF